MLFRSQHSPNGCTRVLIDTSPDFRMQLLYAGVGELDGVVYTHAHADHVHGLDDLRMIVFNMRKRLKVWADDTTSQSLLYRFAYAFVQPEGSPYPPILELNRLEKRTVISGAGGDIVFLPFAVRHGGMDSLGFRIGPLVYLVYHPQGNSGTSSTPSPPPSPSGRIISITFLSFFIKTIFKHRVINN